MMFITIDGLNWMKMVEEEDMTRNCSRDGDVFSIGYMVKACSYCLR